MNTQVVAFVLLLHLVVPSIVKTEMCTCPTDNYYLTFTARYCLREALQAELTSTSANIQQLQNLYFLNNVQQDHVLQLGTTMTVNVSPSSEFLPVHTDSIPVNSTQFVWTHRWYEDNLAGVIRKLIETDTGLAGIVSIDPVAPLLQIGLLAHNNFPQTQLNIQLNCTSRDESIQVDGEKLRDIWEGILQWVSTYLPLVHVCKM